MGHARTCPTCGGTLPCACEGDGSALRRRRYRDEVRQLTLVDGGRTEDAEEQRFTRLVREIKAGVLRRPFLAEDEGRPLLARMRRLGRLVEDGCLAEADRIAEACLGEILQFPRRRARSWMPVAAVLAVVLLATVGCVLLIL